VCHEQPISTDSYKIGLWPLLIVLFVT